MAMRKWSETELVPTLAYDGWERANAYHGMMYQGRHGFFVMFLPQCQSTLISDDHGLAFTGRHLQCDDMLALTNPDDQIRCAGFVNFAVSSNDAWPKVNDHDHDDS